MRIEMKVELSNCYNCETFWPYGTIKIKNNKNIHAIAIALNAHGLIIKITTSLKSNNMQKIVVIPLIRSTTLFKSCLYNEIKI